MVSLKLVFLAAYICSLHFDDDAYCKPLIETLLNYSPRHKRKLKLDAIPTLNCLLSNSLMNLEDNSENILNQSIRSVKKQFNCVNIYIISKNH